jgi:segregation and condensation protein A
VVSGDYTVRLEQVFQGPLDLLLHLVKEQEVEIQEIEISKIIDGYLAYLKALDALDIEYAGDFLVMAATLMAIKSRSLLPHDDVDLESAFDPRDELIQRLMEYRRFKVASDDLARRAAQRERQFPRGSFDALRVLDEREFDLGELTVWDLLAHFSRLMRETLAHQPHRVALDPRPLRYYVDEVVRRLRREGSTSLRGLVGGFESIPTKEAIIGSFCALLELVRLEVVSVRQEATREDILLALTPEHRDDAEAIVRASVLEEERREERAAEGMSEGQAMLPDAGGGEPVADVHS